MKHDLLSAIAQAWWSMPHGDRTRVADTVRGRELARLLDRVLQAHRGDGRLCVCLMPQHGHDVQCPARQP